MQCQQCKCSLKVAVIALVGQIRRKEFQRWIYLRQLMQQQLDRHGKQANKFAQLFAALDLACIGRDGHEKENFCFCKVSNTMGIS